MTSALKTAQKYLKIKNVILKHAFINIDEDIDPEDLASLDHSSQNFRGVSLVKETNYGDEEHDWWDYGFNYSVGVRLIEDSDETTPLVEIKATFSAIYTSDRRLKEEQIKAFLENNVGYHVWPYWREFVQSSCMRLDIELIEVPLYFFPPAT